MLRDGAVLELSANYPCEVSTILGCTMNSILPVAEHGPRACKFSSGTLPLAPCSIDAENEVLSMMHDFLGVCAADRYVIQMDGVNVVE
jgi:hypothetical protein